MPVNVPILPFSKELDFEEALAKLLTQYGWEPQILKNPTEADLVKNWAAIIYNNNRGVNQLNNSPLTPTEMEQVIQKVNICRNPYERNKLINGKMIQIVRDNADDKLNCGKPVYLKLFDAHEISTGQSVYQIVRQPKFETSHPLASTRRGDVMLLINGMPIIHIELKRSGVDVSQAVNQIKKYAGEGVFSRGLFSLVQIFVAMTPEKTLYFANPGEAKNFSPSYYFHWADYTNAETFDWKAITANFLSIPMAHQLVGYYTIADDKDKTLKVLRSYQYYATTKICDRVHETIWDDHAHRGGFIWHTTGSGKTMTSFKAAQLISQSGDADKVVFLLDRIELSIQSLDEYRGFAGENDSIQDTDNTHDLIRLLESDDRDDCLIVTSLQKMSRVNKDNGVSDATLRKIGSKRIVFVVDECHRGVYGSMLMGIKHTFPRALLFGFTGTPVFEANAKGEITTEVIFGDMLHKYTLANGIPDGNVLGFDLYRDDTFSAYKMRQLVALRKAGVKQVWNGDYCDAAEEILMAAEDVMMPNDYWRQQADAGQKETMTTSQREIYDKWMNPDEVDDIKIENEARSLYDSDEHHEAVVQKIVAERPVLSRDGLFHAILATRNIPEAIRYYHLFKERYPAYNIATVFDDSIDNVEGAAYKEDAILEMLEDYNRKFETSFNQATYGKYKKDVAKRLAHKAPYQRVEKRMQIDLLIVVTQMLTGYDSKYVNTLYVDKTMQYVDIIQAFSRTNRLFGPEKPFGIIKYFYKPSLMQKNIDDALELYVDQPLSVFVDNLERNLEEINKAYHAIEALFNAEGIQNYEHLPKAPASRKKFAQEFCLMTKKIEASKMQGFCWDILEYDFQHGSRWETLKVEIDEETYNILLQRYRELFEHEGGDGSDDADVYELEAYITETGAGTINADYINLRFQKFVKYLYTSGPDSEMVKQTMQELTKTFATLSQHDQRTALIILHDIQTGDLRLHQNKTIFDYINDYQKRECDSLVLTLSEVTGLDRERLNTIISSDINEYNIDDQGRFDELMNTLDREKAVEFLRRVLGREVKSKYVMANMSDIARRFILNADDRKKIIFAYQNENAILDQNIPEELPDAQDGTQTGDTSSGETSATTQESNILSDKEKRDAVRLLVEENLCGVDDMPQSADVVEAFFKIINIPTLPHLDGIAIDMFDAFDELFARKKVNFIKKHVCSGNLLIKFEVYLKKLFYLLNGSEVPAKPGEDKVTLGNAIYQFPCLRGLRYRSDEKHRRLSGYLDLIRQCRNTQDGNGAHFSLFANEDELDKNIKALVTMYMYVTGQCLDELKGKYDV